METNKNNSNDVKEFAIGTKIEDNGKLYEVVEDKYCDNCSIANICSSNDIPSGNKFANALSRDQRLRIFGECSNINRADGTDIVFKEIPKTKEQDVYNVAPLYKTNNELIPIQIYVPKDFIIDTENSDLAKGIIKFKNKWLTLEQLYKSAKDNNYHTCLSEIKDSIGDKTCEVREKLIALSNLMDIASYFNRGWNYDFTKECIGYSIAYYKFVEAPHYSVQEIDNSVYTYYGNPVFKNEADAQYIIDNPNFRDILDKIFK